MTQAFSTDEADWQGVDNEPTTGSDNLVKSSGVYEKIDKVEHEINSYNEEPTPISLTDYFGGVMRKTNLLLEASNNEKLKVYYVPVLRGKTYRVTGNNITLTSANFSLIGFSETIPATGVSYIDILSYDDSGAKNYTIDYIAPNNGYLLLGYQDEPEVSKRLSLVRITYTKIPKIGDLSSLETEDKDNLVAAINEVLSNTDIEISDFLLDGDTICKFKIKNNRYSIKSGINASDIYITSEQYQDLIPGNYYQGIMRNTSSLIESTTGSVKLYYFPLIV